MPTLDWQKSSYCGEGDACLNVAAGRGSVKLTESGDPGGAILHTTPATWSVLLRALKENRG
ncbi:DUF397 domain-containing protein [Streptomyces lunaelactis]|uniref:DUF397 domain-containing protein n=1 Tax=Streptomyces lunaelactis TaxID=1535768 RepID=UPI0015848B3F|nr:DUF397 domain-containing protein [Streptomyces lunaelactis]NUK12406.1 DUF397 domain-containing protein [Streptomyces lunaelactis]NUK27635.1 DUF397 domain-containing protein [Streptomyces lunaelactis]NUK55030.1 DUF397 domain-containing protein [Streptomyces lunaelactis]NUK68906.1 DUF397 domain-containing protein [Streptomyces lunaelactis]NUL14457.1 DUF397 domain-containing protein [Streptomyces lunaelactis]